ncbi:hypothetical protein K488DRAFT_86504 [Vararia minispora EC-137]|uniref:Uncharacterized protein n=1 Tax=Vararia minispora EC-137 TaxID=1314806 RepID=A0ACB8QJC2_9AGAM|nr:hypothetical protein K488DRAFT_86504 [Vararia minispora EC-137]
MPSPSSSAEAHEDPVVAAKAAELAAHPAFIARINAMSQEEIRYLLALSLVGMKLSAIVAFQAIPPSADQQ